MTVEGVFAVILIMWRMQSKCKGVQGAMEVQLPLICNFSTHENNKVVYCFAFQPLMFRWKEKAASRSAVNWMVNRCCLLGAQNLKQPHHLGFISQPTFASIKSVLIAPVEEISPLSTGSKFTHQFFYAGGAPHEALSLTLTPRKVHVNWLLSQSIIFVLTAVSSQT